MDAICSCSCIYLAGPTKAVRIRIIQRWQQHSTFNPGMAEPSQPAQGPAKPVYILRGHAAPIHALHIFSHNLRLVSGDAEGWVVIWDLVSKRPVTVWKAHEGAVLEVKGFSNGTSGSEIYT